MNFEVYYDMRHMGVLNHRTKGDRAAHYARVEDRSYIKRMAGRGLSDAELVEQCASTTRAKLGDAEKLVYSQDLVREFRESQSVSRSR